MKKFNKITSLIICLICLIGMMTFETSFAFAEGISLKAAKPDGVWQIQTSQFNVEKDKDGNTVYRDIEGNFKGEEEGGKPTYLISNANELALLSEKLSNSNSGSDDYNTYLNGFYKLTNSIDMGGTNQKRVFSPIDNFKGKFDGGGFSLKYLIIKETKETSSRTALFRKNEGTIINLIIDENSYIEGKKEVASFVCENYGVLKSCVNKGTVKGEHDVAGLVYSNFYKKVTAENEGETDTETGTFEKCYNTGKITATGKSYDGKSNLAGAVCFAYGEDNSLFGNLSGVANHGSIFGIGEYVAGITCKVGFVEKCFNEGQITGKGTVGGIASEAEEVLNCFNRGNIISKGENDSDSTGLVGGIVAKAKKVGVCYVSGNIQVTISSQGEEGGSTFDYKTVGAIAGSITEGYAEKCLYVKDIVSFLPEESVGNDYGIAAQESSINSYLTYINFPNTTGAQNLRLTLPSEDDGIEEIIKNQNEITVKSKEGSEEGKENIITVGGRTLFTNYGDYSGKDDGYYIALTIDVKEGNFEEVAINSPEIYIVKNCLENYVINSDSGYLKIIDSQESSPGKKSIGFTLYIENPGDIFEIGVKWNSNENKIESYIIKIAADMKFATKNSDYDPNDPNSEEYYEHTKDPKNFKPQVSDISRLWSINSSSSSDYVWYENKYIKLSSFSQSNYEVGESEEVSSPSEVENWLNWSSNLSEFSRTQNSTSQSLDTWGTEEDNPYVIKTASQLANLIDGKFYEANEANGFAGLYFRLDGDIDMFGKAFKTIKSFKGVFNGNGYTIKNIYIDEEFNGGKSAFIDVFGGEVGPGTNPPTLKNLKISGYIYGTVSASGFINEAKSGDIQNLYNLSTVISSGNNVSGIVLENVNAEIRYCYNLGTVSIVDGLFEKDIAKESSYAAGISLSSKTTVYKNCYNKGDVSGNTAAGICISNLTNITEVSLNSCINFGNINGKNAAGIALSSEATFNAENCYNDGLISSVSKGYGISGSLNDSKNKLTKCLNTKNVTGDKVWLLAELSEDSSNNLESKNLIFKDFSAADDIVYGDRIVPISDLVVNICNNNYKLGNAFNSSVYKDNRQLTLLKTGDYTVSFNVILNPGTSNEFTIDGSINLSGIAKRKIKLKVNDYEKKTSENPKFTYDVISGSFVDNDRAVLGTKQIEGTNNEFKIIVNKIVDGQGADVSDMYEVEANEGLLTVVEDSTEQGIKPWVWIVVGCLGGVLIALIALAIYLNIKIKNTDGEDKD